MDDPVYKEWAPLRGGAVPRSTHSRHFVPAPGTRTAIDLIETYQGRHHFSMCTAPSESDIYRRGMGVHGMHQLQCKEQSIGDDRLGLQHPPGGFTTLPADDVYRWIAVGCEFRMGLVEDE